MPEIGKIELDDDELDKVSGGRTQNSVTNCAAISPIDGSKANTCDNCNNCIGGVCALGLK